MRKFSILGVSLSDYTAREALKLADRYLHSGALNTLTYITAQTLGQAAKNEQERALLEETDLTFCVEPDILEAAGIAGTGRVREIEERAFLREFLKRLGRQQEGIFILGDTLEQAQEFRELLLEQQENLRIVACRGYAEFDAQRERLMNEINGVAPAVIISRMTWPVDLELMHAGRKFLNAEIWLSLPEKKFPGQSQPAFFTKIRKKIFQKRVNEYNQEKAGL